MGSCLKCGHQGREPESPTCEKCGAVQEKVKVVLGERIKTGLASCDEIISSCANVNKRAEELRSFAAKNSGLNVDWEKKCLDPLLEIESVLKRVRSQAEQLKAHASVFVVDYEANNKLAKLGEYLKKIREELEGSSFHIDELWTAARTAAINHAAGAPREFEPPKGNQLKQEMIEEVETIIHANRYPFMLLIAGFYKAIGWLVALVTVAVALWAFFKGEKLAPQIIVGALLVGPIICISLFAVAESIKVGIDIEQNTRATREYTRGLFMKGISGE